MTARDRATLYRALSEAGTLLQVPITQELADLYWRHLSDLPVQGVLDALGCLLRQSDRLPPISGLRTACEASGGHAVGSQPPGRIGRASCQECDGTGFVVHTNGPHRRAVRCTCRG